MLKRYCVLCLMTLTIHLVALSDRGDDDAKKAETKKPLAVHQVITNKLGGKRYESWSIAGIGRRGEGWIDDKGAMAAFGGEERLTIDNGKRTYSYSKAMNLVTVSPTGVSREEPRKNGVPVYYTGSGRLDVYVKERERNFPLHYRKYEITVTEEMLNGRKVQRVLVVRDHGNVINGDGLYEDETVSDVETDRIFWSQTRRFPSGSMLTFKMDYPEPDKVDKALFKFVAPADVIIRAWVPLEVDEDPKIETCIGRLRALASVLSKYHSTGKPSAMMASLINGSAKIGSDPDIQWCPADERKGTAGYTSYAIANDTPTGALASPEGTVVLECRHHGSKLIVACGDGHVQINPK